MGFRKALAFLCIILAVRSIPREQYGAFLLFDAILLTFSLLNDIGLTYSSTRMIAIEDDPAEKYHVIGSAVMLRLVAIGVCCILLFPTQRLLSHMYKSPLLDLLMHRYMAAALALSCLNDLFSYILLGQHKHTEMAIGQAIIGAISFAGTIAFVRVEHFGVVGLTWSLILSCSVSLVYQYRAVGIRIPICYNAATIKRMIRFGFPLYLNSFFTLIYMRADTYLLGIFCGPSAIACYGVASRLPDNVRQLSDSYRLVYFSTTSQLFAAKDEMGVRKRLETSLRWTAFMLFGSTLGAVLFGDVIIRLLYSQLYMDSVPVFSLLMASLTFFICDTLLGTTLVAAGRPRRVLMINLVTAIVNVTANLLWIPRFGAIGAAYASLLAHAVIIVAYVWSIGKIGVPVHYSLLVKSMIIFALSYTAYQVCPLRSWLTIKLLLVGLYLAASILLGIVTGREMSTLLRRMTQTVSPNIGGSL
jgi:O-antigen/teichoic acid export membrane protein